MTGVEQLTDSFRRIGNAVDQHDAAIRALLEAAEPIRSRAASLAPRGKGKGPHLADNIIAAETTRVPGGKKWRDVKEGEHVVAIGPSYRPEDVFYGAFQEMGTAHHPAQPFMRPAFDAAQEESQRILGRALWRNILSALARKAA